MDNIRNQAGMQTLFERYMEPVEKYNKIEGGFSEVFIKKDSLTNKLVAVKQMKIKAEKDRKATYGYFENETKILIDISFTNVPYIPKIIDFRNDGNNFCIVLEYFEKSLRQVLINEKANGRTLDEDIALKIVKQLAYTFLKINEKLKKTLMHRDIKPENILFDQQSNAILLDFSSAKIKEKGEKGKEDFIENNNTTVIASTQSYIAPEIMERDPNYTSNCDVFSTGLVLYECLFGSPLTIHETKNIKNEYFTRNNKLISKATQNLIIEMVKPKNERFYWEQVFNHPALEGIELDPIFTRKVEDKEDIDEIKIINDKDFKRLIQKYGILVEKIEKWSQIFPKVLKLLESQIKNLKEFALDLTDLQVNDATITELAELVPKMNKIKVFELNLASNTITFTSISKLADAFQENQVIETFYLGLDNTSINDLALAKLGDVFKRKSTLKSFCVSCEMTEATDDGRNKLRELIQGEYIKVGEKNYILDSK